MTDVQASEIAPTDASDADAAAAAAETMSTSERLRRLVEDAPGERVSLGWILDQIRERGFGIFLLVLALPCCIPMLYGVPQVVALPMLAVTAQMVSGRRTPWLPESLRKREIAVESLDRMVTKATPALTRFEKISRPRLTALTRPPLDRLVAVALTLFCVSILVPLPATNTAPGMAVALAALGLLERDGLLVSGALVFGTAWIAALIAIGAGLASLLFGA